MFIGWQVLTDLKFHHFGAYCRLSGFGWYF